jgi:hypothetical protein
MRLEGPMGVIPLGLSRRVLLTGGLLLGGAAMLVPVARAQTVTFGADVSQTPNTAFDCSQRPDGEGSIAGGSCTWTTDDVPTDPSEGLITPAGTGTITAVRIHVGATTGPMELVEFTFEVNTLNENASCCTAAYVSQPFTPAANSITTLSTDLPVHTDGPGEESSPPYQVGDLLALNILEDGVDIPALDETSSDLPENDWPDDAVHWPAYVQGETDVAGGYTGYVLDMNADWEPGTPSSPPPPTVSPTPTVTPVAPAPPVLPTPTLTLAGARPTVKPGKVNIGIDCGAAAACSGTIAIENEPLVGATVAAKSKQHENRIVYAQGSFSVSTGQKKTIAAPLTNKGRTAEHKHQKLTVYIDITLGTGSAAHRLDKKVTLLF